MYETRTENGHPRQVPVTRTKTVTEWRPASGQEQSGTTFLAYAGQVLPEGAIELIQSVDVRRAVPTDAESFPVRPEPFAVSDAQVWNATVQHKVDVAIDNAVKRWAQGSRQQDWHWQGSSDYSFWRVLCPVEGIEIKYQNRIYKFWIDGSDISRIQHDSLPKDARVVNASILGFAPAALVLVAFVCLWASGPLTSATVWISVLALAAAASFGFYRKQTIEKRSLQALQNAMRAIGTDNAG